MTAAVIHPTQDSPFVVRSLDIGPLLDASNPAAWAGMTHRGREAFRNAPAQAGVLLPGADVTIVPPGTDKKWLLWLKVSGLASGTTPEAPISPDSMMIALRQLPRPLQLEQIWPSGMYPPEVQLLHPDMSLLRALADAHTQRAWVTAHAGVIAHFFSPHAIISDAGLAWDAVCSLLKAAPQAEVLRLQCGVWCDKAPTIDLVVGPGIRQGVIAAMADFQRRWWDQSMPSCVVSVVPAGREVISQYYFPPGGQPRFLGLSREWHDPRGAQNGFSTTVGTRDPAELEKMRNITGLTYPLIEALQAQGYLGFLAVYWTVYTGGGLSLGRIQPYHSGSRFGLAVANGIQGRHGGAWSTSTRGLLCNPQMTMAEFMELLERAGLLYEPGNPGIIPINPATLPVGKAVVIAAARDLGGCQHLIKQVRARLLGQLA